MVRFVKAFASGRVAVMLFLGFASGLPNPLTGSTLTAWMRTEGVDLTTIGLFTLVTLPYNFKFVWAPLVDRFSLPFLGRRRGWIVVTQVLLLFAVWVLGTIRPAEAPTALAAMCLAVAFLSASQDIVSDAYRTDLLPANERGSGTAIFVAGYRVALIAAGAGALILSDFLPWRTVYWLMAGLMSIGIIATLLAPEPQDEPPPPRTMVEAVVGPLKELFSRKGMVTALVVVMLYKVGDAIAGHMITPFLMDTGFSRAEIGAIAKGLGLAATIVGALVGGGLIAQWGLRRSLLIFGILQAVANASYALLAWVGKDHTLLVISIGLDNLMNGLGTAAFVALLMSLCNHRFTAMQYALLSSASTVPGRLIGAGGGWLAETAGWPTFFIISIVAAVPALLLIGRLKMADDPPPPAELQDA